MNIINKIYLESSWPGALVNIVFIGGVIFAAIALQYAACLWAFLLAPFIWGYK